MPIIILSKLQKQIYNMKCLPKYVAFKILGHTKLGKTFVILHLCRYYNMLAPLRTEVLVGYNFRFSQESCSQQQ